MSSSRGGGTKTLPLPPPPQTPYPPRPPRRGEAWSPGPFSPAIFLVALVVIGILVAAAVISQRGRTATPAPAVTAIPGASTAPAAVPRTFVVSNTGGQGVYLRRTPSLADRDSAYADGTTLIAIGDDVTGEGLSWHHVRAPDGKTGYVPAQYTTETTGR